MHPLFFPKLLMFLKMKCQACHEFRLGKRQTMVFAAKLHLIDVGRMKEALELDDVLSALNRDAGTGRLEGKISRSEARAEAIANSAKLIDELLEAKLSMTPLNDDSMSLTMHERAARRQILKEFQQVGGNLFPLLLPV